MTDQYYTNFPAMPEYENEMLANPNNAATTLVEEVKKHRALYPEIHYKLEPFISVASDAIETSGMIPTQEEFENIMDNISDEFCKMHPEMEDYMKAETDPPEEVPAIVYGGFSRGFNGFRRRSIGRDLIGTLLLNRLVRRWSPYYPFWF